MKTNILSKFKLKKLLSPKVWKNKIKGHLKCKKREIENKVNDKKAELILEYIMPQFINYVREMIIAEGLDPDKKPSIADKKPSLADACKPPVRGTFKFDNCSPSWLKASFKDPSKHPLYKKKTIPVENNSGLEVTLPNKTSEVLENAIKDYKDVINDILDDNKDLCTPEGRVAARAQMVEKAPKKATKKATKKTTGKKNIY